MVELRSVPGCPNLAPVRQVLYASLADLGLSTAVTEVVGDYPSPSILVNGVDVMGASGDGPAACRLDLPTSNHIRTALRQAMTADSATTTLGRDLFEPLLTEVGTNPGRAATDPGT
jgi:hypothetical protein